MAEKPDSYSEVLSRRRFVALTGAAAGAAALAGCSNTTGDGDDGNGDGTGGGGDGDGDGDGGGTSSSDGGDGDGGMQVHDAQHVSMTNQVPSNIQWNPSNPSSYSQISHFAMFDQFAKYNFAKGEFTPYAISEWNFTGETFELTLRDGLTWSDGDPVTAADVATQLRLGMATGGAYADYTDSIETDGEKRVVMNLGESVNPTIVEFDVLSNNWVQQKESVFGKFVDQIEQNEEEGTRALQEFAWQDPVTSGPFSLKQASQQQLLLERNAEHPDAGNVNFSEYVFRYIDGNQAIQQALLALQIDSAFSVFTPPRIVADFPDAIQEETIPSKWGYGLIPNHGDKHAGDRAVRQAIQYVLDRETIVKNAGPRSKQAPALPVGIPSDDQERWLGDRAGDFESYGAGEQMTDEATRVLEEAGYSKSGGTWQDSDGETVELPVLVPTGWTDWITATETIVDQLNGFGFEATVDSRNFGNLLGNIWPNGNFVLSAGGWLPGGGRAAFPYFSLRHQLVENFRGFTYNYAAANDSRGGSNADVTVPSMDGGEMTVNPSERLAELSQTTDEATANEIILEQAWVTNVDLPMIPIAEKLEQTFLTEDQWDVPEQGSEVSQVRWANTWLPRQGQMQYTG